MSDPVAVLKNELLAAAERQLAPRAAGPAWNRLLLAAAVLPIVAAVALVFTTPWSGSPSFLERAKAALAPPEGMILHEESETTTTSTDPPCTVSHGPSEIWIDETPPYRYRVLTNDFPEDSAVGPRALACTSGTGAELGGTFDPAETLRFVAPDTLSAMPFRLLRDPVDPVAQLRDAIDAGTAHDEGQVQLDGRTVERIRIDSPAECPYPPCPQGPGYAYVDPESYYPVRVESPWGFIAQGGGALVRLHMVERITTYEYLPRTTANLALTDIRAQHPNATGP